MSDHQTQTHKLSIVAVALLALANAMLLFALIVQNNTEPEVMAEVKKVHTELRMSTETTRSAIALNRKEIDRLRAQMKHRTEQLHRANQAILKLDPTFKIEEIDPLDY